VGFVVDKMGLGQIFSEYLDFLCQFSFHQILHTRLTTGDVTIGQLVADLPHGLSLAPPSHEINKETTKQDRYEPLQGKFQLLTAN
jgi:hypothetical protein